MIDGPKLYAYVANNPVNHVDPSGLGGFYHDGGGSDSYVSGGVGFNRIWYQRPIQMPSLPNIDWWCVFSRMGQDCACMIALLYSIHNPAAAVIGMAMCYDVLSGEPSLCDICSIPCAGFVMSKNYYIGAVCGVCLSGELILKAGECVR